MAALEPGIRVEELHGLELFFLVLQDHLASVWGGGGLGRRQSLDIGQLGFLHRANSLLHHHLSQHLDFLEAYVVQVVFNGFH